MSQNADSQRNDVGAAQPSANPTGAGPSESAPRDFAALARRISSRTTDLLAVAILLAGGLAIGGSLMDWWRSEPPVASPSLPPASPWDDPSGVDLDFGGADWSVHRQTVRGSAADAANAVLARLRGIVSETETAALPPIDDAEAGLLEQLPNWSPVESSSQGNIYLIGGPIYWVIATRTLDPIGESIQTGGGVEPRRSADEGERVVAWGLALPQPEDVWTLYLIRHQSSRSQPAGSADFPLPAGARRSLRIAGAQGAELSCFHGVGPVSDWTSQFDAALAERGWLRSGDWLRDDDSATAVFAQHSDGVYRSATILIVRDANGTWRGVIDIQPGVASDRIVP